MPSSDSPVSAGGKPVRETFLPFARPSFGEGERAALPAALDSGWITTGPRVAEFEKELARFTGASHALCLSSCTAALHLALEVLKLKPGDEVITSPMTFCSTVHGIVHAGAKPVLADVDEDTLNLSPAAVRAALTDRTRAVIAVDYGGHPADMDGIRTALAGPDVVLIEDAAHSLGATLGGRPAGALADMGCFSFYATKNITTGEGGALLTERKDWAERARLLSLHGMSRDAWKRYESTGSWYYEVEAVGFKANMTDIQAALGIEQLRRVPELQGRRTEIAGLYDRGFGDHPGLRVPSVREGVTHAFHLYPLRLRRDRLKIDRARFIEELRAENIGTSVHFIPVHLHPVYRERFGGPGTFPVTEAAYEDLISLPIYPAMTDTDAADVMRAVRKIADHFAV